MPSSLQLETRPAVDLPQLDLDPYSIASLMDPYPLHEQVREAGPVVYLTPWQVYAVARYEQVKAVLSDHDTYISGAGVGLTNFNLEPPFRPRSLVLEADPPAHTPCRAVLARVLSPTVLRNLRPVFEAEAEALVDQCLELGAIDGIKALAERYPLKVFPDAVGLAAEGRENLLLYGDMVFNANGPRNELLAKSTERVGPVTEWIMRRCQRDMLAPGGFGAQIWEAADRGDITHEQAPMLVRSLLSAGVDTTINGLGNALFCLATHPEEYAKLHSDPSLARYAFDEALRYESTAQTFYRTTVRDTVLAGVPIPANCKVLMMLAAANRDPRKWPDPDRFLIERRPAGHVAFGAGIHGCVGQAIARLEGELVLSILARRVRRIELIGEPTRRLNNTLRALDALPLRLIPA